MKSPTIKEWADNAAYELHYALAYCGFGFLTVNVAHYDEMGNITLRMTDETYHIFAESDISVESLINHKVSFGELALRLLVHREHVIRKRLA